MHLIALMSEWRRIITWYEGNRFPILKAGQYVRVITYDGPYMKSYKTSIGTVVATASLDECVLRTKTGYETACFIPAHGSITVDHGVSSLRDDLT